LLIRLGVLSLRLVGILLLLGLLRRGFRFACVFLGWIDFKDFGCLVWFL
jgi:hypothetical protein